MKYYFDTEFSEVGSFGGRVDTIELISIGIVDEYGRQYYAESSEFREDRCNPWVREHVLPQLGPLAARKSRAQIRDEILAYVHRATDPRLEAEAPEFWGYYADYDWVVLCQLYGRMTDLPRGWPMYCRDVQQLLDAHGLPRAWLPPDPSHEHHALADALWIQEAHQRLMALDGAQRHVMRTAETWLELVADPAARIDAVDVARAQLAEAVRLHNRLRQLGAFAAPEAPSEVP